MKTINMKRIILFYFVFILTFTYMPLFTNEHPVKADSIVYVWGSSPAGWRDHTHVKKISEGITNVSANGTIYVWAGVYNENSLSITKGLTMIGNTSNASQIYCGINVNVITINTPYLVNISKMYFNHTDNSEIITYGSNKKFISCKFYNTHHGIDLQQGDNILIRDCYFIGNDITYGFRATGSGDHENITFNNNYCDMYLCEIYFYNCNYTYIQNNTFLDTYIYISGNNKVVPDNNHWLVRDNYFSDNSIGWFIEGWGGHYNDCNFINNTFINSTLEGFLIRTGSPVTNCNVSYNNFYNIHTASGDTWFWILELSGNSGTGTKVYNNTIYAHDMTGFDPEVPADCVAMHIDGMNGIEVYNNTFTGFTTGVLIWTDTTDMIFHDNNIYNNSFGIFFDFAGAYENTFTRNYFYENDYGVHLSSSDYDNLFYDNYFNNTVNAYDDGTNIWNITKTLGTNIVNAPYLGGNYWDDYAGVDNDADYLGDTLLPYDSGGDIATGGDEHPLVLGYVPETTYPVVWVDDDQPPGWYDGSHVHTIPEGVNNVTENGTIYVWNGTFDEQVEIYKSCIIIGNGTTDTTIVTNEMIVNASNISISEILFIDPPTGYMITNNISHFYDVSNIYIYNCSFLNSSSYAIDLEGTLHDIYIFNNVFDNITNFAIMVAGGYNHTIINNQINGSRTAITESGFDSLIAGNIMLNGSVVPMMNYGRMEIYDTYNVSIHDNWIDEGDYAGIDLINADDCIVYNNIIMNLNQGSSYGFYVDSDCANNLLYNNYLSDNTINAYDDGTDTSWNITKTLGTNIINGTYLGGNFWDDYTGIDADSDGLGDTLLPYDSSGNIATGGDYHPLWYGGMNGVTNLTIYNSPVNLTQLITWDSYVGIPTVVRHSTTGFPATPTSGDAVYNATGNFIFYSTPTPGQFHFYRAWYYLGSGLYSDYMNATKLTQPFAPKDFTATFINISTVNISWTPGTGSNRTVLVRGSGWYPGNATDGTEVYNGTGTWYHLPITSSPQYISGFGYATWLYDGTTFFEYSYNGTPITFKGLGINCYNESNPSQQIPYNFMVRNANGTDVYQSFANYGYQLINLTGFQTDENVYIRVWTDGYHARERFLPVFINQFYNLSFYLPRKNIGTGEDPEGGGNTEDCILRGYIDSLSCSGNTSDVTINLTNFLESVVNVEKYDPSTNWTNIPTNKYTYNSTAVIINKTGLLSTTTQVRITYNYYQCSGDTNIAVYYCRVVETVETEYSTYDKPVEGAVVTFKRYMNTTKEFEIVSDLLTDANGYITIYLIPNVQYLVHIEKDGYDPTNSSYVPVPANAYGQTVDKIFRLVKSIPDPGSFNYTYMMKNITWSFEPSGITFRTGFTAYFNITSSDNKLQWYSMTVYSYNFTSRQWTNISYQIGTNAGGGSLSYVVVAPVNASGKYAFELWFKKTGYPAFELSQTGSFEKIIQYFSEWMLDIPDYAYYIILLVIMVIISGFAYMYLGAGLLAGYVGLGIMAIGFLIKPVEIPLGSNLFGVPIMISGWLIFGITFIFYTVAIFLWSKM